MFPTGFYLWVIYNIAFIFHGGDLNSFLLEGKLTIEPRRLCVELLAIEQLLSVGLRQRENR